MDNKSKIKEVSLQLFIEKGIPSTSTRMITEAAGISNGALFHHFKSKDDIVVNLYKDFKRELLGVIYEATKDFKGIRNYFYLNFKSNIEWALSNKDKKMFINMVAQTPIIRNCGEYQDPEIIEFLWGTQREALENKEIKAYDLDSLIYNGAGFTDAVINYLAAHDSVDLGEYFEFNFNQYWRSIVNF